jgi:transposase
MSLEKKARNKRIVKARQAGLSYRAIKKRFKVDVKNSFDIVKRYAAKEKAKEKAKEQAK